MPTTKTTDHGNQCREGECCTILSNANGKEMKVPKKIGKEIMDNHAIALRQLGSNSLPALLVSVFPGAAPSLLGEDAGEASA